MALLIELSNRRDIFFDQIPTKPSGRYVHLVTVRETESFPVFQTDGSLNTIRVRAGMTFSETISRLVMFKRKQISPERLSGRELLRFHGVIDSDKSNACEYNSEDFCKKCPDCILYGFAIGDQGAEKSKVYVDSAFSLSTYEQSHKAFSFNGLYEYGTMTQKGKTRSSFGEQDHIIPQVYFPAIITLRDPTYEGFLYVLGNLLRTEHYGAQETRTGRVYNHLMAVVFTNGEVFSNLRFTQKIYDLLPNETRSLEPLPREAVLTAATQGYTELMQAEPVTRLAEVVGEQVKDLRAEIIAMYANPSQTKKFLEKLNQETERYAKVTQK